MQPTSRGTCRTGVQADTVVEVSVRIGDDLQDVAHLDGGSYDAGVCEIPIDEVRQSLSLGSAPLVIESGLATITLRLVERNTATVPHKRVEWRPLAYGAGSLTTHLALVIVALVFGSDVLATPSTSNGNKNRRARISSRFATEAQTTKQAPKPEPAEVPITTDTTPADVPAVDEEETGGAEQVSPLPLPGEPDGDHMIEPDSEAGRQRRFDPNTNAEFDTVKVGAYSTVSAGKLAGDQYGAEAKRNGLIVVSCDATTCLVLGGEEAAPIRKAVEEHLAEITACYANESGTGGKKVEIDLGLDNSGNVDNLKVGGVGDVGNCVAAILKRTTFNKDA